MSAREPLEFSRTDDGVLSMALILLIPLLASQEDLPPAASNLSEICRLHQVPPLETESKKCFLNE